jgi:branched-chain amino acid transport system substrate-binding protein
VKKFLAILLAVALALSIGLIGCGGGEQEEEEEEEAPTAVLLGATLPQTGIFAGFGEQGFGMQKAVDDQNAEGGIYLSKWDVTVPVELIIKDNQSDPTQVGPQSVDLVVTEGVHALLSPNAPCDLHDPTTVVATDYGVPSIIGGGPVEPWFFGSQGGVAPAYTWFTGFAIGDYQPAAPRNVPGYTMVDTWFMFMDEVGAKTNTNKIVGVFASSDSDGTGWYEAFPGILEANGYTVADVNGKFAMDPMPDFTDMVHQWQAEGVEILWGNCPGAHFGALWSTCYAEGFRPKICLAARAALFPNDVESWGTNPPLGYGVGCEMWWAPTYQVADGFVGIGGRTAGELAADWAAETGDPLNRSIGTGYAETQVMLKAIELAGDVDGDAINAALAAIDMDTINGWVKFESNSHFSAVPLSFGQWYYDEGNTAEPFTQYITNSALDIITEEASPLFPLDTLYP